jgi:hypothetical protein
MVAIDVDSGPGLVYLSNIAAVTGEPMRTVTTLHGEAFEFVGDDLRIGTRRYGPIADGSVLHVTKNGVLLNSKPMNPR